MTFLYRSHDVMKGIRELFSTGKGRRVALVGFVGDGAEAYLPKPKSLELICWPKAGGTNPKQIIALRKRGIKVQFASSLHMKVYWAEDKGAIITSANLSTNALGAGDLKEVGVGLCDTDVDIDKLIEIANPREVTKAELTRLAVQHKAYWIKNPPHTVRNQPDRFPDWVANGQIEPWKLGLWWGEHYVLSNCHSGSDY